MRFMILDLQQLFNSLPFPIIACDRKSRQVICVNSAACLLLEIVPPQKSSLGTLLRSHYESDIGLFWKTIETGGRVQNFALKILTAQNQPLSLILNAQSFSNAGGDEEIVVINLAKANELPHVNSVDDNIRENELLFKMLYMTYHSIDPYSLIEQILEILGTHLHVETAYVFEETSPKHFSNTYEWLAGGVKSRKNNFQDISQEALSWDIIQQGLCVTSDISVLPGKYKAHLARQGAKAAVVLPLFIYGEPIGFIGCNDHKTNRIWTSQELRLIESTSAIVSNLLLRKRNQAEAKKYQEIMRTVLDNTSALIYVSDFDTYEILFANKYLTDIIAGKDAPVASLEGKLCWQTIQKDQTGPCSFCPKPKLLDKKGKPKDPYTWEHKNERLNKWFLITDSAIQWIDGRYVHMENARDISDIKQKEEELQEKANALRIAASTDSLTGIFNRQMGTVLLQEAFKRVQRTLHKSTLCFLDLDGLKKVNDTYGHREGDRMIVSFAGIIRDVIRGADIFCRWGGDEFILLLEGCDVEKAQSLTLQRIKEKIDFFNNSVEHTATPAEEPRNFSLAFSYGLEEIPVDGNITLDQLIAIADQKMYENKVGKRLALL